ncbi:MAG: DNRLRE domain-containing protein, partial [SAR202 cluster bacterium]|nr:DNRLRE domain-containing protein [SAR202 cluster bacterium]
PTPAVSTPAPTPTGALPTAPSTPVPAPTAAATPTPGGPTQVVIEASRDTTIFSDLTGNSNGAGAFLFSGRTRTGGIRRALVHFDLAGKVPAGAEIVGARLSVTVSKSPGGADPIVGFRLHRVTAAWGEGTSFASGGTGAAATPGDATWTQRIFGSTPLQQPGGDFEAAASAETELGASGQFAWDSEQLLADVRGWLQDPAGNYGWIVIGDETTNRTPRQIRSSEAGTAEERPRLVIVYRVP